MNDSDEPPLPKPSNSKGSSSLLEIVILILVVFFCFCLRSFYSRPFTLYTDASAMRTGSAFTVYCMEDCHSNFSANITGPNKTSSFGELTAVATALERASYWMKKYSEVIVATDFLFLVLGMYCISYPHLVPIIGNQREGFTEFFNSYHPYIEYIIQLGSQFTKGVQFLRVQGHGGFVGNTMADTTAKAVLARDIEYLLQHQRDEEIKKVFDNVPFSNYVPYSADAKPSASWSIDYAEVDVDNLETKLFGTKTIMENQESLEKLLLQLKQYPPILFYLRKKCTNKWMKSATINLSHYLLHASSFPMI